MLLIFQDVLLLILWIFCAETAETYSTANPPLSMKLLKCLQFSHTFRKKRFPSILYLLNLSTYPYHHANIYQSSCSLHISFVTPYKISRWQLCILFMWCCFLVPQENFPQLISFYVHPGFQQHKHECKQAEQVRVYKPVTSQSCNKSTIIFSPIALQPKIHWNLFMSLNYS